MRLIVQFVMFWIVVLVAIRLAVCFPQSLLAHVLFTRIGPARARAESEADYLLRWCRFGLSWVLQASSVFAAGYAAVQWDPSWLDSLLFAVSWAVIVPLLAIGAGVIAATAFARWIWIAHVEHTGSRTVG